MLNSNLLFPPDRSDCRFDQGTSAFDVSRFHRFLSQFRGTASDLRVREAESKLVQPKTTSEEQEVQKLIGDIHGTLEETIESCRFWGVQE
jgi:hypothetical protein